jgi:signal transduction histidine kinase
VICTRIVPAPGPDGPPKPSEGLGRRARELAAVHQIAARVSSAASADDLVATIMEGARQAMTCDAVAVYLCRPHGGVEPMAARGFTARERVELNDQAAQYLCAKLQTSQLPAGWVGSVTSSIDVSEPEADEYRLTGVISAPLIADGRLVGALFVGSRAPRPGLGADDYHLAAAIADRVAVAITDAQKLRSEVRRISAFSHSSESIAGSLQTQMVLQEIVRQAAEALAPSSTIIGLLDEDTDEIVCVSTHLATPAEDFTRRWSARGSLSSQIVHDGATVVIPSAGDAAESQLLHAARPELNSFLGVPIQVQGRVVGHLSAYSRERQHYQRRDVELLQALAVRAGIALEQASLQELVTQEKARFEAIVESMREGVVFVDPRLLVAYASARFMDLVGVDATKLKNAPIDVVWSQLAARSETPDETRALLAQLESHAASEIVLRLPGPRVLVVQRFTVQAAESLLGSGYLVRDVTRRAEVERLKDSILGMVSHELRTPLSAIKGFASALLQDSMVWDRAVEHDFLVQIEREADRMTALVRNLLDMSRLEAGTLRFEWESCDLLEVLQDVLRRFAPNAPDHPLDLVAETPSAHCTVDRRFMERVVWNLLDNAVKYSGTGAPIVVRVGCVGTGVHFSVADRGVGIGAADRERIFERFVRGATATSTTPGSGLGLAICRAVVNVHGGTLTVQSEPGRGSTFCVDLPARAALGDVVQTELSA